MLKPSDIRINLRNWVSQHLCSDSSDAMIDELGFVNQQAGRSVDATFRADLALANGRLVGFEIKSGADTLKRWQAQCIAYYNVFDEVWLCTHGRHLEKALGITPKGVGILLMDDLGGVAVMRPAVLNTRVNAYDLSGLLWREDLDELCEDHDVPTKKRETKAQLRVRVSQSLPIEYIRVSVLRRLKAR